MNESLHYPFLFNFREAVSGDGFLAGVTISGGRALMLKEDGEWWMYGVRPAGLAETGETSQETFLRFIDKLRTVFFDIATSVSTFEEFRKEAEQFFYQSDKEEEARWNAAQQAMKACKTVDDNSFLSTLPKESPENRPTSFGIVRLDDQGTGQRFSSSDNVVSTKPLLAA